MKSVQKEIIKRKEKFGEMKTNFTHHNKLKTKTEAPFVFITSINSPGTMTDQFQHSPVFEICRIFDRTRDYDRLCPPPVK